MATVNLVRNLFRTFQAPATANVFRLNTISISRIPVVAVSVSSSYQYQQCRCAGHSKWANIKHTKQSKDMERSREIVKFTNMIKIAVKEGGGADPKTNSKLAQTIVQIKEAKLPMGSFDRMLQNFQAKKEHKSQVIPIKGPGSCVFLVELSSENLNRAKQDINTILRKNKGLLMEDSALYQFTHKGIIYCSDVNGKPASEENLEEAIAHAIEGGADDVIFLPDHPEFGGVYEFNTSPSSFFRVKHALERLNYNIVHGDVDFIPIKVLELEESDFQDAHRLYQKLSDLPEVVKISANIA